MSMTVEERQLRAWVRTLFRRAALRWLDRQHRQEIMSVSTEEEGFTWQIDSVVGLDSDLEDTVETELWLLDCRSRLTPHEAKILDALYRGWKPADVAHMLQCNVSTVRRVIYRIRNQCPRWDG